MRLLPLAARLLRNEWRSGELRVLAAALVVAVAAMAAVGLFTDRVRSAMTRQAGELLAADRVVETHQPADPAWLAGAEALGLATARTAAFRTMVAGAEGLQMAEVKAVSDAYPLRGTLRTAPAPYAPDLPAARGPAPGSVWLEARLAALLGLEPGATVQLGAAALRFERVLTYEPDRGGELFTIAPRLLMHVDDLARTELVGTGSLVHWRLLLAGEEPALDRFVRSIGPFGRGQRLLGGREARPEVASALDRAERFLGLAALVSVLLAGVAAATAAQRYARRHFDASAILRCLGLRARAVAGLFTVQLALLGFAAAAVGAALGYAAQAGLSALLGELFAQQLPAPSLWPLLWAAAAGLVTLGGFALPPLLALRRVPPARVLRRELGPARLGGLLRYGPAVAALLALMAMEAGDLRLTTYVFGGAIATWGVLWLAAAGLVAALAPLRRQVGVGWRFGLANIPRRAATSRLQAVAFGLGLMVLLLLSVVRGDLLAGWRESLSADAPNHFLINIQPDQVAPLGDFLAGRLGARTALYPMVRGRWVARNGAPVDYDAFDDPRARRLAEREFNLSHAAEPAPDNRVVAGRFWNDAAADPQQWSVERGLAETLGIRIGDRLRFDVAGQPVEGTVTSLRTVDWDSFRVNFFVVAPPALLADLPASFITSFHVTEEARPLLTELVRTFPNVTIIDVDAILSRVRAIIDRAALAVEFVFGFTLLAGVTVLLAAVQATHDERRREAALLRTLGAGRGAVRAAHAAEFLALGALAGLLAGGGAGLVGAVVADQLFHLPYRPGFGVFAAGLLIGAAGVGVAGLWGTRQVLAQPPLVTLRQDAGMG